MASSSILVRLGSNGCGRDGDRAVPEGVLPVRVVGGEVEVDDARPHRDLVRRPVVDLQRHTGAAACTMRAISVVEAIFDRRGSCSLTCCSETCSSPPG
jgi:hypothetical protein